MNNKEFLDYCESHSHTERCGFVGEHLARLAKLAGKSGGMQEQLAKLEGVVNVDPHSIRNWVYTARGFLDMEEPKAEKPVMELAEHDKLEISYKRGPGYPHKTHLVTVHSIERRADGKFVIVAS